MTESVKGKTVAEADALFERVQRLITAPADAPVDDLGALSALAGVRRFPVRVKCATLPWHALRAAAGGRRGRDDRIGPFAGSSGLCEGGSMDRRETERLLDAIRQARAAGEPAALATVVRVKGARTAAKARGCSSVSDGTYECALSGGCLEPTVAEAAARVIATGEPVIVSYDLADDSIWGLGIGCSGAVDIRIERIDDDAITHEWWTMLERGEAAVLVTPLSGVSGRMIVRRRRSARRIERSGGRAGGDRARPRRGCARRTRRRVPSRIGGAELFFEVTMPPPELVIFGAGHDAAPVAQLAWTLGFAVTVVDVREAFLTLGALRGRHAGVRAFQPVRRARDAARPAASC